jgi:hypothetical protein
MEHDVLIFPPPGIGTMGDCTSDKRCHCYRPTEWATIADDVPVQQDPWVCGTVIDHSLQLLQIIQKERSRQTWGINGGGHKERGRESG